jgi:hypothetical protein
MATGSKPKVSINAPIWSAAQKREMEAIGKRADAIARTLTRESFNRAGNPVDGGWKQVLADLDAWAAKHKVELLVKEYDRNTMIPGNATPFAANCPAVTTASETYTAPGFSITMKYKCYLRRQTWLGRCVYSCSYEFVN